MKAEPLIRDRKITKPPPTEHAESERLIDGCQGLVRSLAWKIHRKLPPYVDLEDLIAFGQVGLAEAARDFDPTRTGKFTTYAYYRIRGAIFDGLSKMRWFSPHDYHSSRYEQMANEYLHKESGDASAAEPRTLEDDARWFTGVTGALTIVYLATEGYGDENSTDRSLVAVSTVTPTATAMLRELRERVRQLIDALPSDAGALIRDVYFEGLTLQAAGERLGISRAWASRLHAKTLHRLAVALRLMGAGD